MQREEKTRSSDTDEVQREDQHVQNTPSRLAVVANDNNKSHNTGWGTGAGRGGVARGRGTTLHSVMLLRVPLASPGMPDTGIGGFRYLQVVKVTSLPSAHLAEHVKRRGMLLASLPGDHASAEIERRDERVRRLQQASVIETVPFLRLLRWTNK